MDIKKIILPFSHRKPVTGETSSVNPTDVATVSIVLKDDKAITDPAMIPLLKLIMQRKCKWDIGNGPAQHVMHVTGPLSELQAIFGVELKQTLIPQGSSIRPFRVRAGDIQVPDQTQSIIKAVLGLDNRPAARPYFRPSAAQSNFFSVLQLGSHYQLPLKTGKQGQGRKIGILELGGGFNMKDMETFFGHYHLPLPKITVRSVLGAKNDYTGDPNSADGEVTLDIQVAGGIAPKAEIFVYFTPNTEQGFYEALVAAVKDNLTSLSISWGGPEDTWSVQALNAISEQMSVLTSLGCTITAAAGDSGSNDGEAAPIADFPASCPFVLGCGGTTLRQNDNVWTETVWGNGAAGATGGGISSHFGIPGWQDPLKIQAATNQNTHRGVPDVSAVADPNTGYQIYLAGQWGVIGGTSAVAPLWAGYVALIGEMANKNLGFINPLLYTIDQPTHFNIITQGTNGAYSAQPNGWSACTGLGSPIGAQITNSLR